MTAIIPEALDEQLPSHYDPNVSSDIMEVTLLPTKTTHGFSGLINLKRLRSWDKAALDEVLSCTDLPQRMKSLVELNQRMYEEEETAVEGVSSNTTEQIVTEKRHKQESPRMELDTILEEEADGESEIIPVKTSPKHGFDDDPPKPAPAKRSRRAPKKPPVPEAEVSPNSSGLSRGEAVSLFNQLLSDNLGLDFLQAKPIEPDKQVYFSVGEGGFLVNYHAVVVQQSFVILIRDTRFKLAVQYTPKVTIKDGSDVEFFEVTVDDEGDERGDRRQVLKCAYGGHAFRLGCLDCFMLFRGA